MECSVLLLPFESDISLKMFGVYVYIHSDFELFIYWHGGRFSFRFCYMRTVWCFVITFMRWYVSGNIIFFLSPMIGGAWCVLTHGNKNIIYYLHWFCTCMHWFLVSWRRVFLCLRWFVFLHKVLHSWLPCVIVLFDIKMGLYLWIAGVFNNLPTLFMFFYLMENVEVTF